MTKQFILIYRIFLKSSMLCPVCLKKKKKKNYLYFLYGGNIDLKYNVSRGEKCERKVLPGTLPLLRNYISNSSLMQCAALNI